MFCHSQMNNSFYIWGYTPITIKRFILDNEKSFMQTNTCNVIMAPF